MYTSVSMCTIHIYLHSCLWVMQPSFKWHFHVIPLNDSTKKGNVNNAYLEYQLILILTEMQHHCNYSVSEIPGVLVRNTEYKLLGLHGGLGRFHTCQPGSDQTEKSGRPEQMRQTGKGPNSSRTITMKKNIPLHRWTIGNKPVRGSSVTDRLHCLWHVPWHPGNLTD